MAAPYHSYNYIGQHYALGLYSAMNSHSLLPITENVGRSRLSRLVVFNTDYKSLNHLKPLLCYVKCNARMTDLTL